MIVISYCYCVNNIVFQVGPAPPHPHSPPPPYKSRQNSPQSEVRPNRGKYLPVLDENYVIL